MHDAPGGNGVVGRFAQRGISKGSKVKKGN